MRFGEKGPCSNSTTYTMVASLANERESFEKPTILGICEPTIAGLYGLNQQLNALSTEGRRLFVQPVLRFNKAHFHPICKTLLQDFIGDFFLYRSALNLLQKLFETAIFGEVSVHHYDPPEENALYDFATIEIVLDGITMKKIVCQQKEDAPATADWQPMNPFDEIDEEDIGDDDSTDSDYRPQDEPPT